MVVAMLLAHLFGDYVLQPNRLAQWKSRQWSGVFFHCAVVIAITWLFMLPFDGRWWPGLLLIGGGHLVVDVAHFALVRHSAFVRQRVSPLARFLADQAIHISLIVVALLGGGFLTTLTPAAFVAAIAADERWLVYLLGYAFLTMPGWVLIKFISSDLVLRTGPDWTVGPNKYVGMAERLLLATLVLTGQLLWLPLAAAPRLLTSRDDAPPPLILTDLLFSLALALVVGLLLRQV